MKTPIEVLVSLGVGATYLAVYLSYGPASKSTAARDLRVSRNTISAWCNTLIKNDYVTIVEGKMSLVEDVPSWIGCPGCSKIEQVGEPGCSKTEQGCSKIEQVGEPGCSKIEQGSSGCSKIEQEGCSKIEQGCSKTEQGCSKIEQGCSKTEQGCSKIEQVGEPGCSKIEQGCSKIEQGCSKIEQGCSKIEQGCSKIEQVGEPGCSKIEQGCSKIEQGCSKIEQGCSKTEQVDASPQSQSHIYIDSDSVDNLKAALRAGGVYHQLRRRIVETLPFQREDYLNYVLALIAYTRCPDNKCGDRPGAALWAMIRDGEDVDRRYYPPPMSFGEALQWALNGGQQTLIASEPAPIIEAPEPLPEPEPDELAVIWQRVLATLRPELPPQMYDWMRNTRLASLSPCIVTAPDKRTCAYLTNRMSRRVARTMKDVMTLSYEPEVSFAEAAQ